MKTSIKNISIVSILTLIGSFLLVRFVFFQQHGMNQWPVILLIATLLILLIALWSRFKILTLFISISYLIGYYISYIFETTSVDQGGGATSNQWILWAIGILVISLIGLLVDVLVTKRNKPIIF